MSSRILAIDPGSSLGWASNATGRLEWGTESFHIQRGESSGNRWRRFGRWLDDTSLGNKNAKAGEGPNEHGRECGCMNCNAKYGFGAWDAKSLDLIIYEAAHFMPSARYAAEVAAGMTTRLEEHCERHGIALQPVPVMTLKAFACPAPKRPAKKKGDPPRARHDNGKGAMIAAANAWLAELSARGELIHMHNALNVNDDGLDFGLDEHQSDAIHLMRYAQANCGAARRR